MDEGSADEGKASGEEDEESDEVGKDDEGFSLSDLCGDELGRDFGRGDGEADGEDGVADLLEGNFPQDKIFEERSVHEARADEVETDSGAAGFVLQAFENSMKCGLRGRVGSGHGIAAKGSHGGDEDDFSVAALDHFRVGGGEDLCGGKEVDPVDIFPVFPQGVVDCSHGYLCGAVVDFVEDDFLFPEVFVEFEKRSGGRKIDGVDGGFCAQGFEGGGQFV